MSDDDRKLDQLERDSAAELVRSLGEAYEPRSLDPCVNEMLIERALLRFDCAPATEDALPSSDGRPESATVTMLPDPREREAADRLRAAFDGELHHPLFELAQALQAAHSPSALDEQQAEAARAQALSVPSRLSPSSARAWPYAMAVLAMAAGAALWINAQRQPQTSMPEARVAQLAQSRSLSPLFTETFDHVTPTQRMDRIYAVRSRELRQNRFVTWRVR